MKTRARTLDPSISIPLRGGCAIVVLGRFGPLFLRFLLLLPDGGPAGAEVANGSSLVKI
jgi:hypothetical protein